MIGGTLIGAIASQGVPAIWTANNATLSAQDSSLVAYWKAEDLTDEINSHTLTNTATTTFTSGKNNNAFTLNGSSQKVQCAESSDFNLNSTEWTISLWVKPTTIDTNRRIMLFENSGSNGTNGLYFDSSTTMTVGAFGVSNLGASASVSTGSFQHICVTRVGTATTIYINGTNLASNANYDMFSNENKVVNIGGTSINTWGGNWFNGQIDEVAIWKGYGADSTFVSALYNSATGSFYV